MDPEAERVLARALQLAPAQRETLARWLIESLDGEPDPDPEKAWEAELDRRLADLDSGKVQAIGIEEFRKRIFSESPPPEG
jgi:putative addiction module component (TIGR02574 family)